ncbi:hypothetical protein RMCBS344292_08731 [Rhizopus microsporus]|nr:hypothetical protein RMCBS344292_08731 [Rhizopus microsporus]
MFPKISLAKMCLHRLGVLDPAIQQGALQMHWLIPFVKSAPNGPLSVFWFSRGMRSSIVIPRLADYLLWHLKTLAATTPVTWPIEDYRLAFLFKDLRPPSLRSLNSAFTLLFRAVDLLPPSYELTVPNGRTCLELPVSVVLRATPRFTLHRSLACVRLSSTYVVDTTTGCLRAKINSELDVSPILARKFLQLVKHDDILLSNFLIRPFIPPQYATNITDPFEANVSHGVDADPFLESLSLIQKEYAHPFNSKGFRVFCARDSQLHPSSTRLRPRCWTRFWDISLPHSGHNVWFRLLHDKLPHRSLLHRLIPSAWPESCPLCYHPSEPMDHFLFLCPEKFDRVDFYMTHLLWRTYLYRRPCSLCTAPTTVSSS